MVSLKTVSFSNIINFFFSFHHLTNNIKMKKTGIIVMLFIALLFMGVNHSYAQQKVVPGPEWNFVLGDWVGEGSGKPGEGAGWFTFNKDLEEISSYERAILPFRLLMVSLRHHMMIYSLFISIMQVH